MLYQRRYIWTQQTKLWYKGAKSQWLQPPAAEIIHKSKRSRVLLPPPPGQFWLLATPAMVTPHPDLNSCTPPTKKKKYGHTTSWRQALTFAYNQLKSCHRKRKIWIKCSGQHTFQEYYCCHLLPLPKTPNNNAGKNLQLFQHCVHECQERSSGTGAYDQPDEVSRTWQFQKLPSS